MTIGDGGLALEVSDVTVRFGAPGIGREAVRDLSLEVPAGSFTVVIGPNGCGKSTLLRLLAGLVAPSAGRVSVGGGEPRAGDGRTGIAFQQPRLIPWRSALGNVVLPLELAGSPHRERVAQGRAALGEVGLTDAAALRPRELSGGMQQRLALARALIADPSVLLLDEPFSALDALTREGFNAELQRIVAARPRTVVMVTHSVIEAVQLADRVAVLTSRPGHIAALVDVPLPRPRSPDVATDRRAAALVARVRQALQASRGRDLPRWGEGAA